MKRVTGSRALVALALASGLTLAACAAPAPQSAKADTAEVTAQVEEMVASIVAAVNADDVDGTVQFNAPDYEFYSHGLPNVVGAEAARENIAAMLSDPAIRLGAGQARVEVAEAGDMAVYSAPYTWAYTDTATGQPVPEQGNWILIFKRQPDGTLKVWREIASDTPPAE